MSSLNTESHLPVGLQNNSHLPSSSSNPTITPDNTFTLKDIPPSVADILYRVYVEKILPQYPFLDGVDLYSRYQLLFHEQENTEESVAKVSHFIIAMVMSISVLTSKTPNQSQPAALAKSLHQDAMLYYDALGPTSLIKLQCMILLCQYAMFQPGDANIWNARGISMRMAVALGLHHEGKEPSTQYDDPAIDLRRRIFWVVGFPIFILYNVSQ